MSIREALQDLAMAGALTELNELADKWQARMLERRAAARNAR
jgi:hypothetical protein